MKKMILIFALFLSACTDHQGAIMTLQKQGYENITITGYPYIRTGDFVNVNTPSESAILVLSAVDTDKVNSVVMCQTVREQAEYLLRFR